MEGLSAYSIQALMKQRFHLMIQNKETDPAISFLQCPGLLRLFQGEKKSNISERCVCDLLIQTSYLQKNIFLGKKEKVLRHYTVEEAALMNSGMNDNDSRPQDKLPVPITFFLISGDDTVKTCRRKRCCIYRSGLSHHPGG